MKLTEKIINLVQDDEDFEGDQDSEGGDDLDDEDSDDNEGGDRDTDMEESS